MFLRMQTSLLKFHASVVSNCETNFWTSVGSVDFTLLFEFLFPTAHCFVNQMFCTSVANGCLQPLFLMSLKKQKYFLNESAVCSENFTVRKLIIGLLNICTTTLLQLGYLKHIFWIEFATEWFFQKIFLLANVERTLCCCHCAVRARPRR